MSVPSPCGVCRIHEEQEAGGPAAELLIYSSELWRLRHHPFPSPLPGWLLLDTARHLGGAVEFDSAESASFGQMLKRSSLLVRALTDCDRVYAVAFGEGARHLHVHLIPRHGIDGNTESWAVADVYRAVVAGERPAASEKDVHALIQRARQITAAWPQV